MNDDPYELTDLELESVSLVPTEDAEGFPGRVETVHSDDGGSV